MAPRHNGSAHLDTPPLAFALPGHLFGALLLIPIAPPPLPTGPQPTRSKEGRTLVGRRHLDKGVLQTPPAHKHTSLLRWTLIQNAKEAKGHFYNSDLKTCTGHMHVVRAPPALSALQRRLQCLNLKVRRSPELRLFLFFTEKNAGNPQILITFRLKLISSTAGLKTSTFLLLIGSTSFTPRYPISN